MALMMKAAVVREFKKPLTIEDAPVPVPRAGQILVKIATTGVCHPDLHASEGDWPHKTEEAIHTRARGDRVRRSIGANMTHLKEGDLVGVAWLYSACGRCEHSLGGWETLCERQENSGYSVNGSFAEYCVADPNYEARIPATADMVEIAPVLCAGVTVYKGLKITEAKPGQGVVISGIGEAMSRPSRPGVCLEAW